MPCYVNNGWTFSGQTSYIFTIVSTTSIYFTHFQVICRHQLFLPNISVCTLYVFNIYFVFLLLHMVFVSSGCWNKLPQTGWLKTKQHINSLTVLEAQNCESGFTEPKVKAGLAPPGGSRGEPFPSDLWSLSHTMPTSFLHCHFLLKLISLCLPLWYKDICDYISISSFMTWSHLWSPFCNRRWHVHMF